MKRNNTWKWMLAAVIIVTIIVVIAVIGWLNKKTQADIHEQESNISVMETGEVDASETALKVETENESEQESETDANVSLPQSLPSGSSSSSTVNQNQALEEENETIEYVQFPYTIPNTNVQIVKIDEMDGVYVEDGSDEEVSDVAAIVVKNNDAKPVEYISIQLKQGDRELQFQASDIKAGSSAVVMESNRKDIQSGEYTNCQADVAWIDELTMSENQIKMTENEDGSLKVENISGKDIGCVRVFYKFYMEDQKAYVGGITYNAKINDLKKDSSVTITPSHYMPGYSEIVMIRTYDEAQ